MLHLYLATLILSLSAVLLLESVAPLHAAPSVPLRRWLRNLTLSVLALSVTLLTPVLFWAGARALGIEPGRSGMGALGIPVWLQWVLTFVLMDGLAYLLHRLSHALPWLWRLHAVHHSDVELDATTTHRHHPLENLVSTLFVLPWLLVLAPPAWAVLAYSMTAVLVSTLSHGNLALPQWLEHWLRPLVVTPAFHRTHHSAHQPQTDSNYATVLPLFDHLLRTASPVLGDGGRALTIGLGHDRTPAAQSVPALLGAPFRRKARGAAPA